jgi:hypothetical protein
MSSSTSPCQHIRRLSLSLELWQLNPRNNSSKWVNDALPILAACLLDVTKLDFDFIEWDLLDNAALLSGFQKVKHLTINFSEFDSAEQMIQLIASFPSLTHLSCPWTGGKCDAAAHTPLPLGLQTITLDSQLSFFFHQLLNFESRPIVRGIKFLPMRPHHIQCAGTLLRTLGSSLEVLDLGDLYSALGHEQTTAEG